MSGAIDTTITASITFPEIEDSLRASQIVTEPFSLLLPQYQFDPFAALLQARKSPL